MHVCVGRRVHCRRPLRRAQRRQQRIGVVTSGQQGVEGLPVRVVEAGVHRAEQLAARVVLGGRDDDSQGGDSEDRDCGQPSAGEFSREFYKRKCR